MASKKLTQKEAEQRKFEEFYLPEDFYGDEEEEIECCDYDLDDGEGCVEPALKAINCCFECWLFQEAEVEQEEEERKDG